MSIKEYQKQAERTLVKLEKNSYDLLHMCLGLQTESAEISDVFKKKLAYNKDIDWVNVKEEIGDLMWYIANLCNLNEWDLENILETNINKLKIRFPEKFTNDLAINRDLLEERKTLEK
jgi:NTP pyrophosphatase (non-canonical NTP hydrolase)